ARDRGGHGRPRLPVYPHRQGRTGRQLRRRVPQVAAVPGRARLRTAGAQLDRPAPVAGHADRRHGPLHRGEDRRRPGLRLRTPAQAAQGRPPGLGAIARCRPAAGLAERRQRHYPRRLRRPPRHPPSHHRPHPRQARPPAGGIRPAPVRRRHARPPRGAVPGAEVLTSMPVWERLQPRAFGVVTGSRIKSSRLKPLPQENPETASAAPTGRLASPRYNRLHPYLQLERAMSTPATSAFEGANPAAQADTTPLRFVTAASLFDGHDAAINIMRRLIQSQGAEVIHLGHNRSVEDVVRAALQEDADAIALSSYQGGHVEYMKYMVDMLREHDAGHIRVVGGGGGTITPEEIRELEAYGVERIYHPNDGRKLGLVEMIEDVIARVARNRESGIGNRESIKAEKPSIDDEIAIGRVLSAIEDGTFSESELDALRKRWARGSSDSRFPIPDSRQTPPA